MDKSTLFPHQIIYVFRQNLYVHAYRMPIFCMCLCKSDFVNNKRSVIHSLCPRRVPPAAVGAGESTATGCARPCGSVTRTSAGPSRTSPPRPAGVGPPVAPQESLPAWLPNFLKEVGCAVSFFQHSSLLT